jgi:hypothetical protein
MTFMEWIEYGVHQGFCTPPICEVHDGVPLTTLELDELTEHGDTCVPVIRLWTKEVDR